MRPPRLLRALLGFLARTDDRDFMLDDLDEEFADRLARDGASSARRWYRTQVTLSLWPTLRRRLQRHSGRTRTGGTRPARGSAVADLTQDFRFAGRSFRRRPDFTMVALVTLTVGIAAVTTVFSVVNGVLLKRVPGVPSADGIVEISRETRGGLSNVSYLLTQTLARKSATLDKAAAIDWSPVSVGGGDRPEVRLSLGVTASYFDILGVTASRGRLFAPDEATFPAVRPVVVISERLRADRYPDLPVPGGSIVVNGVSLEVVGVAGGGFRGHAIAPVDVFVPMGVPVPGLRSEDDLRNPQAENVEVLGRLRPGVTRGVAQEEITALAAGFLASDGGLRAEDVRMRVDRWGLVPSTARPYVAAFLTAMLILVGLVLAMACTNVASMVLSRSVERSEEVAVRAALGAGRGRIARQLLSEAVLLSLAAGLLAIPLSVWLGRLLLAFKPPLPAGFDLTLDFGLDWRVLTFAVAAAVGSAILFNLAPALHAARTDVAAALKGDAGTGRTRTWGRAFLVSGQMALSLALLVTAGLFLRSITAMGDVATGWNADGVWVTDLDLELTGTQKAEGATFFPALVRATRDIPGVTSAGLAHKLPLGSISSYGDVTVEGMEPPPDRAGFPANMLRVSPGYFSTLDLSLLAGRGFTDDDIDGAPLVTVVNQTMAKHFWPDGDAVGRSFHIGSERWEREVTVVGVVEDARYQSLFEKVPNFYYLPTGQWYNAHLLLFVKADPARITDVRTEVAGAISSLQPNLPAEPLSSLNDELQFYRSPQRIAAWVSGALGLLGLLLGAVGVYGVTAFAVSRRVREIGVRMALGATRRDVLGLILREGMRAPLIGVAVGLAGAYGVARLVSGFLAGVGVTDAVATGGSVFLLLGVALVATLVPAWRAARSGPVSSLRSD